MDILKGMNLRALFLFTSIISSRQIIPKFIRKQQNPVGGNSSKRTGSEEEPAATYSSIFSQNIYARKNLKVPILSSMCGNIFLMCMSV
uniref:Uncharacterized protein n=1 Tax=Ditylenchus dipsaci TaxID=166011 RepID=A0A915EL27_9BILA